MQTFKEQLLSGKPFIWKTKHGQFKLFSISDDYINGVRHIYSDTWHSGKEHHDHFTRSGIAIGSVIYDPGYYFNEECITQGLETKSLLEEQRQLKSSVINKASKIINDKTLERAKATVELAKNDLSRVRGEAATKGEEYRIIDYAKHDSRVSKKTLE